MHRRQFLEAAVGSCVLVAGCASPFSPDPVHMTIINRRERPLLVSVKVLLEDASAYSEASVFEKEYSLEATGSESSTISQESVFRSKKAIIEVSMPTEESDHYHYYPSCTFLEAGVEDQVVIEINKRPGDITFSQNSC